MPPPLTRSSPGNCLLDPREGQLVMSAPKASCLWGLVAPALLLYRAPRERRWRTQALTPASGTLGLNLPASVSPQRLEPPGGCFLPKGPRRSGLCFSGMSV